MISTSTTPNHAEPLWFSASRRNSCSAIRLFCFPYAGGGALIYRSWLGAPPDLLEVFPVRLPGREARLNEAPFRRIEPLINVLSEAILPYLDRPFAFFGHSMGAKIAFELARRLSQKGLEALHLFVSGARGPQAPRIESPTYALPEFEFLETVRELNGTPNEVLENPELMRLIIPLLRADFELVQNYVYNPGPTLRCPITAFGGLEDRHALREHIKAWARETSASFTMRMFPGDHFFINTSRPLVLQSVAQELQGRLRKAA
jgi:medium-chain acyl-[acyl-carrier-protein] hydrolase